MPNQRLNEWEKAYIAEIRETFGKPNDLTDAERYILEQEIILIEGGTISFTGPDTVEERIERLRNHFP